MAPALSVSALREKLGPRYTEVVRGHRPMAVKRGADELALLLGADEALSLVADRRFEPEVFGSGDSVSFWLPQLELYGQGADAGAAREDLLAEVRVYVDDFLMHAREYVGAPNRSGHLPYVIRAYLADLQGKLAEVIFPPAPPLAAQST